MDKTSASILSNDTHVDTQTENEFGSSDDSEVSVANLNRCSNNDINAEDVSEEEEANTSYGTNAESDNEIVSDDEYVYSEDSLYSDDSCKYSDMTNVTPRSSLSAGSPMQHEMGTDYPAVRRRLQEMALQGPRSRPQKFNNVARMCSSADDSRYSISNEIRMDSFPVINRRRNMSFTNDEMRKIELENQSLLRKIMAQQKPQVKLARVQSAQPKQSNSAIHRRKLHERIEHENMILLRKIQEAKPRTGTKNTIPGYN